jgi:hypothetical protein
MRGYAGIRALERLRAQFVGCGLNRDLASHRQRVYIHLMTRINDGIPSERAELSPDAWRGLLAMMDRGTQPDTKLSELGSVPLLLAGRDLDETVDDCIEDREI